jgi:hypothetical protein
LRKRPGTWRSMGLSCANVLDLSLLYSWLLCLTNVQPDAATARPPAIRRAGMDTPKNPGMTLPAKIVTFRTQDAFIATCRATMDRSVSDTLMVRLRNTDASRNGFIIANSVPKSKHEIACHSGSLVQTAFAPSQYKSKSMQHPDQRGACNGNQNVAKSYGA